MHALVQGRVPRLATLLVASSVALVLVAAPSGGAEVPATGKTVEIDMKFTEGKMYFEGPKTVTQGDSLKIVNRTDPKRVGPHTFSLVKKGTLPKTASARKACFQPKHICYSIAKWHEFNFKTEKVGLNPVDAGAAGWSTAGNNSRIGDSWYTEKKGEGFTQKVTAATGDLFFICAVHSWMQGKIKVVAPSAVPAP